LGFLADIRSGKFDLGMMLSPRHSHNENCPAVRFAGFLLIFVSLLAGSLFFRRSPAGNAASVSARDKSTNERSIHKQQARTNSIGTANDPLRAALLKLPLSFEPAARQNEFITRGAGYDLLLTPTGSSLGFPKSRIHNRNQIISIQLAGANVDAKGTGRDPLPGKSNYLIGNDPSRWRTNIATFAKVHYQQVYPGIDLVYYGNRKQLEYDFELAPGADPRAIRFVFNREVRPRISATGDLVLKTAAGEIREQKPVAYQEIDGERHPIQAGYVLFGNRQVGFEIDTYDRTKPLVIDPTLVYSTYLGGGGDDSGGSIAVDSNNNIYVAGTTGSTNFPLMNPAYPTNAGLSDIFVAKIDAAGANLVYSTYVGGSGVDRAAGIALDSNGNAYVVGRVDSSSTDFPTTSGVIGPTYRGGDFDGVVLKLNVQGNGLVYSTYLGAEENDSVEGIAVDSSGNAYLTGGTKSSGFPTTITAVQGTRAGDTDAYLTKINSAASSLLYSTYLGGGGTDRGSGVAIDANGNAYLAGYTASGDFPTVDAFQDSFGGSFDAFIAKIDTNASGTASLVFCTYLGGTADDKSYGIALDSAANNAYVVGQTSSSNFPVLNPAQPASGGNFDAFIAKISSAGAKVYATYLGGSADDRGTGIAVNSSGSPYVTGFTFSTNFPTVSPLQIANGGGADAFVAKLNSAGSAFLYSTYLGGNAVESATGTVTSTNPIALDASSNAYITGYTSSTNFPTVAPLQAANAGGQDAFIAKIADPAPAADYSISAVPSSHSISPGSSADYTVTATPAGGFTGTISLSASGQSNDSTVGFNPPSIAITDASPQSSTLTVNTTAATPPGAYTLTIDTISGNLQHSTSVQLIVQGAQSVNLNLTKTASPNPGIALANLTYRITVTNNGPSPGTNVSMTDTLPGGVNFVSATPTQGSCGVTSPVICNLGSMANGAQAVISIAVTPQSPGQLTNTASVGATEVDPDTSDNSVTIQTNVNAPASGPSMLDPHLFVNTVVSGLSQPTMMAFLSNNDFFVLEKNTGKVQRVTNGVLQGPVLDLAVNSASERGLLGIALHPNFFLNGYVYLYWTKSSTGADSTNTADVATLANRLDRYIWNGSTLVFDRNLITLRAYQADAGQQLRGNHNGGILRFGPDGKLYLIMGDNGRRGFLQNNQMGPVPDDQYGGPEPDDAHLTGFILRLNDDGSTPTNNPFFNAPTLFTGQAAMNIRKLYAYGVRNSFGMMFDPLSGNLWTEENGDDCCDEINHVTAGFNGGWVQIIGPVSRIAQYKQIETTYGTGDLQQLRWPPSLIADTPADALARLYVIPGSHYADPEFSWKYAVAPSTIGFVQGRGLGARYEGNLFVGASRTFLSGGYLFRFKLSSNRQHLSFDDSRLNDLVADNIDKFDITESETLLAGQNFGITTDIETGPNGDVFVVSNTDGKVYEISGAQPAVYVASLDGAQEVPPTNSTATGTATLVISPDETNALVALHFSGLSSAQTAAHIHGPALAGSNAPILFPLPEGQVTDFEISLTPDQVQDLRDGKFYINVHSSNFPNGEIRGQFASPASASSVQFGSASYFVTEGAGHATITVTRFGDTSTAASVDYATSDGSAINRTDYTSASNRMTFAPGETSKSFSVLLTDDVYVEGNETINISLSNATGPVVLGSPSTATLTITDNDSSPPAANPLDDVQFFVRQHYIDFLSREADPGGLAYWASQITQCGNDAACIADQRINVSAAFFFSLEFQQTGSFVYGLYKGALGRQPNYPEFTADHNRVIGGTNLNNDKAALANDFVQRPEFLQHYPASLPNKDFVNNLFDTAGLFPFTAERQAEVDAMNNQGRSRAQVVQDVIDIQAFKDREFKPSFVLMQYFGYLRRDVDPGGYAYWLDILNTTNNFRGMVCAFLSSLEYQARFSSVWPHSNAECATVH
jgi:uncharacterized repeat protein (TIGR01451 family)